VRQCGEELDGVAVSGVDISDLYFLTNAAHFAGVSAAWANFTVSSLGARFGNQTS